MFERFLRPATDDDAPVIDRQQAACALLVAAARADGVFAADEARTVALLVAEHFDLSPEDTAALVAAAAGEERLDLYPVTRWLVANTSRAEREDVLELMWRVVMGDGRLEAREDALMHRVGKLLQIPHKVVIARKLAAGR